MIAGKFILLIFFCVFGSSLGDVSTDAFAGDLLKVVFSEQAEPKNTVVSSVSLYDVLGLLHQGTGGNTEEELTKVLHADAATIRQRYRQYVSTLKGPHVMSELEFANKIYVEKGYKFESNFKRIAVRDFQADIDNIEFLNAQDAANTINEWVSNNTHGRIKELVSADALTPDTVMVLLNAIFFAGNWTRQFDAHGTKDSPFTSLRREIKNVPTMHLSGSFVAGELEELKAKFVRLPFQGNEFSMIFAVPNEVDGLKDLIDALQDHLSTLLTYSQRRNIDLYLPKFKFSTTSQLVPTLQKLGVHDLFTNNADLSGIGPNLYVSHVVQKAEIEVDERGATASAATSVGVSTTSLPINILNIKADHPFVFFFVHDVYRLPLFSGWVAAP